MDVKDMETKIQSVLDAIEDERRSGRWTAEAWDTMNDAFDALDCALGCMICLETQSGEKVTYEDFLESY